MAATQRLPSLTVPTPYASPASSSPDHGIYSLSTELLETSSFSIPSRNHCVAPNPSNSTSFPSPSSHHHSPSILPPSYPSSHSPSLPLPLLMFRILRANNIHVSLPPHTLFPPHPPISPTPLLPDHPHLLQNTHTQIKSTYLAPLTQLLHTTPNLHPPRQPQRPLSSQRSKHRSLELCEYAGEGSPWRAVVR